MAKHSPPAGASTGVRVYSYIRFSSPEQSLGDSERRQLDEARAWAKRKGHEFDETLQLADRGLSAFHGTNRKRGALGQFLNLVEEKRIPAGSILLIENVDRLSREDFLTAFETIRQLITNGITICTITPPAEYTRESLQGGLIYQLVGMIQVAHESSSRKSSLGFTNWAHKRELAAKEGRILTGRLPAWLTVDGEKIESIPAAAQAVREIFKLRQQGLGVVRIATVMNSGSAWKPRTKWRDSYVKKILRNPATIGIYQPHRYIGRKRLPHGEPIADYFPVIVDPKVFFAVQKTFFDARGKGGRRGKAHNLLVHLAVCAYCGAPMRFLCKTVSRTNSYLTCSAGARGAGCQRYRIRYDETECTLLENLEEIRPDQVLPSAESQESACQSLRQRIDGAGAECADLDRKIENLTDQIASSDSKTARDRYEQRLIAIEQRIAELTSARDADARALADAEKSSRSFDNWKCDLSTLKRQLAKGDVSTRQRMQSHLREFIARIDVFCEGHAALLYPPFSDEPSRPSIAPPVVSAKLSKRQLLKRLEDGEYLAEMWRDGLIESNRSLRDDQTLRDFMEYVNKRRMSKEGRFLRVHFKSGQRIDLVPDRSLASGWKLGTNKYGVLDYKRVEPTLARLWKDFKAEQRRNAIPR